VADTGCGMDDETRKRVFEPFFTTKEMGHGTGLGLSMVYGLVKQHNGFIWLDSAPDRGTTFELYLPVVPPSSRLHREEHPTRGPGGAETILLAEDDDMVARLTRTILERAGYTVLTARDGVEAVGLFRQHAETIDLLLFDVTMPRCGGVEAYEQIRALRPGIRVLLASGYHTVPLGSDAGKIPIVEKPTARDRLLQKVREVLELPEQS